MDNVIDLAARRAERQKPCAKPGKTRLSAEALKERQRETIEQLRALGYEMSLPEVGVRS